MPRPKRRHLWHRERPDKTLCGLDRSKVCSLHVSQAPVDNPCLNCERVVNAFSFDC